MYGSPSTATRKLTALSMPRTAGLSGSSRVWFILRKPSDSTVARIDGDAPIGLFIKVALMVSATRGRSGGCCRAVPTLWRRLGLGRAVGRGQALADDLLDLFAAQLSDLLSRLELLQRGQGRAHGVDGVVGAVRLGQDVLDPGGLDHSAHRAARDDAGARRRGLEHDAGGAPLQAHLVRDRGPDHRDRDHVALGDLHALADGLGHLAGLADACADAPVHVADHDQRAERELPPALDYLGDSVDAHDAVGQLRTLSARLVPAATHVS